MAVIIQNGKAVVVPDDTSNSVGKSPSIPKPTIPSVNQTPQQNPVVQGSNAVNKFINNVPVLGSLARSVATPFQNMTDQMLKELYYPSENIGGFAKNVGAPLAETTLAATGLGKMGPAQTLLSYLIGGAVNSAKPAYNWLTSPLRGGATPNQDFNNLTAIPKAFAQGGEQGVEKAPFFAGISSLTQPLIGAGVNTVTPDKSSEILRQLIARGTGGALTAGQGAAMNAIQNKPNTPTDIATNFGLGALFNGPSARPTDFSQPLQKHSDNLMQDLEHMIKYNGALQAEKSVPNLSPDVVQSIYNTDVSSAKTPLEMADLIKKNLPPDAQSNPTVTTAIDRFAINAQQIYEMKNGIKSAKVTTESVIPKPSPVQSYNPQTGEGSPPSPNFTPLVPGGNIPSSYGPDIAKAQGGSIPEPQSYKYVRAISDRELQNLKDSGELQLNDRGRIPLVRFDDKAQNRLFGMDGLAGSSKKNLVLISDAQNVTGTNILSTDKPIGIDNIKIFENFDPSKKDITNLIPQPQSYEKDINQMLDKQATETKAQQKIADIQSKFVDPTTPDSWISRMKTTLSKLNPWRLESNKIQGMGEAGDKIVTLARRANDQAIATSGELRQINQQIGIPNLSDDELTNVRAILEGRAEPINDKVAQVATDLKQVFNQYGQATQQNLIENYFPRRLNDAGRAFYQLPENKNQLIDSIAEEQGIGRMQAVKIADNGLRKGTFENSRVLDNVPEQFRLDPKQELYSWENEVARRIGIIQNFGPKDEVINNLLDKVGVGNPREFDLKREAQTYVDRVAGRIQNTSELDPLYNTLKGSMIVSKINPLTSMNNLSQAPINSYLKYGPRGVLSVMGSETPEEKQLIDSLGVEDLGSKITDGQQAGSFAGNIANKWMKFMGMTGGENLNFRGAGKATYDAANSAFETLKQDPSNMEAKKTLNDLGMFIEDSDLARALLNGKIPEKELKIGVTDGIVQLIFPPTPGEKPAWANTGAGSTAYIFHNYMQRQLGLLAKAPLDRQLLYLGIIAPLTGLPPLLIRKAIQGKPLPKNPADWYAQSATAGPGTPLDIYNSLSYNPGSAVMGGFSPIADFLTAKGARAKAKSAVQNFVPFGSMIAPRLFPPKNQQ